MGFAEAITKRPVIVVIVWIVIAALAFPLFAKLSSIVHEKMYTLPESSESMKAMRLLEQIRGNSETHVGILIVDNVDLKDNTTLLKLVKWAEEFNNSVAGRYASRVETLPLMLAETNRTLYKAMLLALNQTVNRTIQLYKTVVMLDEAWNRTLVNVTSMARQANETIGYIMAADKGYVEAYRGLTMLRSALQQTMEGLAGLDAAYVNATRSIYKLMLKLNETARGLAELDKAYATLYRAGLAAHQLASMLSNRSLVCSLTSLIGYEWWQVSRAYYYLNITGGNYTAYVQLANLTAVDPRLAPLPEEQALAVYQAVSSLVARGYSVDNASFAVAVKLASESVPANVSQLLGLAAQYWAAALEEYKSANNITNLASLYQPPPRHVESQLAVFKIVGNISEQACTAIASNAANISAGIVAKQLEAKGLPASLAEKLALKGALGTLQPLDAARIAVEAAAASGRLNVTGELANATASILYEYDPNATATLYANRTLALDAAAKLLAAAGAPADLVEAAAKLLAAGADPWEAARRLAAETLAAKLPEQAKQLLPIVVEADPRAKGVLAANKTLAAQLAARLVYEKAVQQGMRVDRELVERLAQLVAAGRADNETLRRIALEAVAKQAEEKAGREAAEMIATILEKYDPNASGLLASNTTLAAEALYDTFKSKSGGKLPLNLTEFIALARNPDNVKPVAARTFMAMAVEKAPPEARGIVAEIAETIVREGPGVRGEKAWNIVERIMLAEAQRHAGEMAAGFQGFKPPAWLASELVEAALRVARGMSNLEAEAAKLATRLLLEDVAPKMIEESKRLMVSKDYTAFTVMLTPLGETQSERAENVEKAGEAAKGLLEKYGLSNAAVYVSGEDVLLQQVRSYAVKDAEKASKLSELGTFIVLLVLLESLFAVLLPYLGIVLGLAVGGAIVYLAASHGIIDFSSHTQSVMITTALGLGADYAGYLVHRFREEYALTSDAREAARRSLKRAGPAIVASALTVMIGFGSLLLAWDISFLRGFGEAIPIAVGATAAATLTLVPALLALVGGRRWFWWPRRPSRERIGRESRLMASLIRHEKAVMTAIIALIIVAGYFYATFEGTHDMKLMLPSNAPALKATKILSEKFEAGITDPIYVIVELKENLWESSTARSIIGNLTKAIESIENVGLVLTPLQPTGKPVPLEQAKAMGAGFASKDGKLVLLQVILSVDPYSREGVKTVREVHRVAHEYAKLYGVNVYVDGSPYATLEMDDILTHEFYTRVLPAAAALMILAFTLIFGGFTVSVAALSVIIGAAMTGIMASVLIFKYLLGEDVLWFLHIISLAAVMGVGMDYNSFFLARALEEYQKTGDPKKAVVRAAGAVSRFIIGLSLVVTVAYLALMTASNTGMREMGFTLATTVFVAGLMASYLLTPLVVSVLGRRAWWPWGLKRRIEH